MQKYLALFKIKPWYQSIFCVLIIVLTALIHLIFSLVSPGSFEKMDIWTLTTAMLLFYIIFNIAFGMNQQHKLIYYRDSVYGYVFLVASGILVGKFISGISVFEAKTYSWIIFVFSLVFILFLSLVSLIRKIVEIALRQEQKLRNENH
ncbi:MAG: hypothetical protein IPI50_12035 [Saprospiraceae bacterium]|nr:hypothetical protein [Saprospiraceae bacterium]